TDILMPEMSGYELCKRIRSDVNLRDIPVIIVTALSDPTDVLEGLEAEADNFITKPYDEGFLISRIQYMIANKELRKDSETQPGINVFFSGKNYYVTAERTHMLDLLLSTYESAYLRNRELIKAQNDLKELNERLEETVRELAASNKELDAFSYSVSHDLRAPLRHMSGFVELLKKRLGDSPDVKTRDYVDMISAASKKMSLLIDDLLNFSRLGRSVLYKGKVNLKALVGEVVREIQNEKKERNIRWELDELPDVVGDESLLRLVVVNLVSNAVKFTSTRPLSEIKIGCKEDEDKFTCFIKDNGVGFDTKYADKLFGVFERAHTQNEFEGTGIGLANVQRIISRHGGSTWAEGTVGQGATFYFTLPKIKET
ncbi:MAG TPA: ATP-binding protein, partial [Dissulfurispiraceae bacterium]|nr:ATP-binding protein [Dissulfurispiraceae bacterium]